MRLGSFLQAISNIGTALVLALIFGWKLTLVIIGFLPAIVMGGAVQMKVAHKGITANKQALETAGKVSRLQTQ